MTTTTPPPTILAIKQAFLEQETRRLAQPLAPSRAWLRTNRERRHSSRNSSGGGDGGEAPAAAEDGGGSRTLRPLPERVVDAALFRTNQLLRQHVRRVCAPQAVRHVAEQLDQLYWQAGETAVPAGEGGLEGALRGGLEAEGPAGLDVLDRGTDYANPEVISALPAAWEDAPEAEATPAEARRYAELVAHLQELSARRSAAEARVQQLRRLAAMVAPFAEEEEEEEDKGEEEDGASSANSSGSKAPKDARGKITRQDNVVTRNGPIERELERMRVLLARVSDRVAALQRDGAGEHGRGHVGGMHLDEDADVEAAAQRRTRALLEQF